MDKEIIISIKTIFLTFLGILALYVVYRLASVIGLLAVATLLVISMEPLVSKIMQITVLNRPISRSIAVILSFTAVIALVVVVITVGWTPVFAQAQKLFASLGEIISSYGISTDINFKLDSVLPKAATVSGGVLDIVSSVFNNITLLFSFVIISIYMSLDWVNLKNRFFSFWPNSHKKDVQKAVTEIETSVGHWVKGEAILMLVVGLISYIGLLFLDVDYPLALGLISGVLEIVPMLGPVIAAVIAAIVAFVDSPVKGIGVIILFTLIQQLENNILVPKIMQKVSGFRPLTILLALLVGSAFFGVVGAVVAIPATMVGGVILKHVLGYAKS